jgi:uncharacterized protein (TIGR03067 family)
MRRYRLFLAAWVLAAGGALLAADQKGDKENLQGNWKLVGIEEDGKLEKIAGKSEKYFELKIAGSKITVHNFKDGKAEEATFKIDPKKTPKTIDIKATTGEDKGKTLLGIYELTGKELKLCLEEDPDGDDRPKSFKSKVTNVKVYFLERAKS